MVGTTILVALDREGKFMAPGVVVAVAEHARSKADADVAAAKGKALGSNVVYRVAAIRPDTLQIVAVQLGEGDYGVRWCRVGETLAEAAAELAASHAPKPDPVIGAGELAKP